ncbi:DUF5372 family protein [Streptomyces sp. NPDC006129]|uniref:DUF5372 family protein n=1 Tax=Streptomyces sp. NPDC006129 TaxID=3155348 RepID=UPI0033A695DB
MDLWGQEVAVDAAMTDATPANQPGKVITVTHPLHPLRGRQLRVRAIHRRSGEDALICDTGGDRFVTVLRSWTDCEPDRESSRMGFQISSTALGHLQVSLTEMLSRLCFGMIVAEDQRVFGMELME